MSSTSVERMQRRNERLRDRHERDKLEWLLPMMREIKAICKPLLEAGINPRFVPERKK